MPIDTRQATLEATLKLAPVVPVVVIHDRAHAVPLARALVAGGTPAIEVTLRTPVALDAIRAIAAEVDGAYVGAGTVLSPRDLDAAERAGARFAVSPGTTPDLLDAADDSDMPLLPGAATASEVMTLLERGYTYQKCFPAEAVGGAALLRSWAGPLPAARFCPTGGITAANARDYLALPNVICVGGSWLAPRNAVEAGDWNAIEALARAAAAIKPAG
ncbi:MAG: bifunctional 4-hydroxy-2-oxoglutarate aldolase/2-dehydro-3-deoxy-phosphogluconate aldolase [Rhodanobacteraceae bacterium]|jgi:2-dehydro-3-deoxyphosphogluconate aldolase/(4S)-4-hydroxy-2-oxoglutarate aldolase|nr:MAG: bifunctional 4-hydroxy-2-oxoglutarate aldolase/2-dehydro-3-deoxy-phosphogluconate aldolase [Rhodanobacteraceae bacterium]